MLVHSVARLIWGSEIEYGARHSVNEKVEQELAVVRDRRVAGAGCMMLSRLHKTPTKCKMIVIIIIIMIIIICLIKWLSKINLLDFRLIFAWFYRDYDYAEL